MTKVELFNRQVERLRELKYHEAAHISVDKFLSFIYPLKMLLPQIKEKEGFEPFAITIPRICIVLVAQAERLNIDSRLGTRSIGVMSYAPGIVVPKKPYLATQIEFGNALKEVPPNQAIKKLNPFFGRRRWPLTIEEGYSLTAHFPERLKLLAVDLAGSEIDQHAIPGIWIDDGGPWICRRAIDRSMPNRGVGSCEKRLYQK